MPTDAPTAFFSYSREDSEFAIRLAGDLKAAGAVVWIDQLDIEPGQEWDNAIEDAVTQCPRMLLILTAASVKSKKVRNEIAFALDEEKTIIPVLCEDCMVPLQLRRIQHIDFRTDYARGLKALLKILGAELQAASAAAASATPVENHATVSEAEPRVAAEQKQLEDEHKQAVEQARVEEERRQAEERARLEEERRLVAAQKARLEQQEREQLAAAEKARLEQQERERQAAERLRLEHESSGAPVPSPAIVSPATKKITLAVCGILVASVILYWTTRPKQEQVLTQRPEVQNQASSPSSATENSSGNAAGSQTAGQQKATESLSAEAMNGKGDDYYGGKGVPKDYKQAVDWYRKAAAAGNADALDNLGWMYRKGYGVKTDYKQAVSWYRKAAEAGNASGMTHLGYMYDNGYGLQRDYKQAVIWYRKGAEAGNTDAMTNLGAMYEDGTGVEKDNTQAIAWYRKAAAAGNSAGMDNLGMMYEYGRGVEKDQQEALSWYRKAAQLGDQKAKDNLKRLGESP